ncbi:MAG: DHH family phosphoesterase [Clostridia bacterium]|nr:DHH family phosphoesterase [Clostridia bacterium]
MLLTLSEFAAYLSRCREEKFPRLFVLGHAAPDGDAVISSLFEGWRLTLQGELAVPVVQADALPREVAWLLGSSAPLVLTAAEADMTHPDSRFVLTDHHHDPLRQRQVVAVVDHHPPATDLTGVDVCIRPVGATTTLVAQQLEQQGYTFDDGVARLLLGGVLLDTDGLSPRKATAEDLTLAQRLSALCGEPTTAFYDTLQAQLLSETDVAVLYRRDYRTYFDRNGVPLLGFAILKVWDTTLPSLAEIRRLLAADLRDSGCVACVAKVMPYTADGGRGQQVCLAAGEGGDLVLTALCQMEGAGAERTAPDTLLIPPTCPQWGRKRYAAHLLPLLEKEA